jgi:hypothetical protein
MTNINGQIYIINPMFGDIKPADYLADGEKPGLKDILEMVRTGDCETFTMASGDRLIAGKGAFGMKGPATIFGRFAFLKEVPDFEKNPDLMKSFKAGDVDLVEVSGPALIVGPAASDTDSAVTSTTLDKLELMKRIAWDQETLRRKLLIATAEAGAKADNDNADWDDSVYDEDLVKLRADLTDEELAQCPCPGCKDEMARRAVEAGGSRAVN